MDIAKLAPRLPPPDLAATDPSRATRDLAAGLGAAGAGASAGGSAARDGFERASASSPFTNSASAATMAAFASGDIEAAITGMMQESSQVATADLRSLLEAMGQQNETKQGLRDLVGAMRQGDVAALLDGKTVTTARGYGLTVEGNQATVATPEGETTVIQGDPHLAPHVSEPLTLGELATGGWKSVAADRQPSLQSVGPLEVRAADGSVRTAGPDDLAAVEGVARAGVDALIDTMKQGIDSMSEMGEMESLRLQMAMDRMSKMLSTLSNLLKKSSDTAAQITQNLK